MQEGQPLYGWDAGYVWGAAPYPGLLRKAGANPSNKPVSMKTADKSARRKNFLLNLHTLLDIPTAYVKRAPH